MNLRTKQLAWLLISTVILGALIYVSDPREFVDVLSRSDKRYVVIVILCGIYTLLMWSVVWHRFFKLLDIPLHFRQSVRLLLAGTFLNAITPLGRFGGEPFIATFVASRTDATTQQALSSVSSSDLSNALPFLTFGAFSIVYVIAFGQARDVVVDVAIWVGVLILFSVVVVYLLWFGGARSLLEYVGGLVSFRRGFGRWQSYVESGKRRGRELLVRMEEVGDNPRSVAVTLAISHLAVLGHIGAVYFALLAVGVDPVIQTVFVVVTLSAFLTFSPTPGSMGAFEAGFAGLIVVFFPVTTATATSVAILYRIGTFLPGLALGYISLLGLQGADLDNTRS